MLGIYTKNFEKKKQNYLCVVFIIGAVLMCSLRFLVQYVVYIPNDTLFNLIIAYAHLFLGTAIFFVMYLLLSKCKYRKFLSASDKYSYYVYLAHQIFILGPLSLITHTGSVFVAILAIAVFTVLIERTTRVILGFCMKAR